MNEAQVKLLKDSYMKKATRPNGTNGTSGEYMRFITDCNLEFVTSKDMVIADDTNGLVHCVCLNEDVLTQGTYPVKIISAPYEDIHAIEAVMSRENFEKFLDEGFLSNLSVDKKNFMIKWFRKIPMQRQQASKATPYYTQKPSILNMVDNAITRDDGVTEISAPATLNYDKANVDLTEGDDISASVSNGVVDIDDEDNDTTAQINNDVIHVNGDNVNAEVVNDMLRLTEI